MCDKGDKDKKNLNCLINFLYHKKYNEMYRNFS